MLRYNLNLTTLIGPQATQNGDHLCARARPRPMHNLYIIAWYVRCENVNATKEENWDV